MYSDQLNQFPPSLIIEAEYDYYRFCNEAFAAKLDQAGVPTEILTSFSVYEGTVISSDAPRQTGVTMCNKADQLSMITIVFKDHPSGDLLAVIWDTLCNSCFSLRFGADILQALIPNEIAEDLLQQIHGVLYSKK